MFEFNEEKDIDELEKYIEKNSSDMPAAYYINTDVIKSFLKDEVIFTPFIGGVRHEKNLIKIKDIFLIKLTLSNIEIKLKKKY